MIGLRPDEDNPGYTVYLNFDASTGDEAIERTLAIVDRLQDLEYLDLGETQLGRIDEAITQRLYCNRLLDVSDPDSVRCGGRYGHEDKCK